MGIVQICVETISPLVNHQKMIIEVLYQEKHAKDLQM